MKKTHRWKNAVGKEINKDRDRKITRSLTFSCPLLAERRIKRKTLVIREKMSTRPAWHSVVRYWLKEAQSERSHKLAQPDIQLSVTGCKKRKARTKNNSQPDIKLSVTGWQMHKAKDASHKKKRGQLDQPDIQLSVTGWNNSQPDIYLSVTGWQMHKAKDASHKKKRRQLAQPDIQLSVTGWKTNEAKAPVFKGLSVTG